LRGGKRHLGLKRTLGEHGVTDKTLKGVRGIRDIFRVENLRYEIRLNSEEGG